MKNGRRITQLLSTGTLAVFLCMLFVTGIIAANAASSGKTRRAEPSTKTDALAPHTIPLLVDVGADKCIPCKMMAPILEGLKKEYTGVLDVLFVDAWKNPDEARKYGVRGIPTQIFYDASGKELGRHMGYISKEDILREFEQLGVSLNKPAK